MDNSNTTKNQQGLNNMPWFSHVLCSQKTELPAQLPDICEIISSLSASEVVSVRIIKTPCGKSYEGQYLSGKKVVVEIKLKNKILYSSFQNAKSLHIFESCFYQVVYIVIPFLIKGTDPEVILYTKHLKTEIQLESDCTRKVNNRCILNSISLLVNIHHIPTY